MDLFIPDLVKGSVKYKKIIKSLLGCFGGDPPTFKLDSEFLEYSLNVKRCGEKII